MKALVLTSILCMCSDLAFNDGNVAATLNFYFGKHVNIIEIGREYMKTQRPVHFCRQKRAFPPFQHAWKSLLQTVYGS